jgi:hypothetical protein
MMLNRFQLKNPTVIKMRYLIIILSIFCSFFGLAQEKNTVYIIFDASQHEMKKVDYTKARMVSANEPLEKSIHYQILQKDPDEEYDNYYEFFHNNYPKKVYEEFGGEPPIKLIKDTAFLRTIKLLDIAFFRTTDYIKVCKTFEAEDSWEQDVIIFIIDKDEIQDGKVVLREVSFSRPAKE